MLDTEDELIQVGKESGRIDQVSSPAISLPELLDLQASESLRDTLFRSLGTGPLTLDAATVERMSTPCVQVLLAAGRTADSAATPFRILNASDAFQSAIADLGLRTEFDKWVA